MVHKLHGRFQSKTVLWSDTIMECMMKHIPHLFSLATELGSISGDTRTCRVTSAGLQKISYSSTKYHYMTTTLLWVIMQWAVVTSYQQKPEITVSPCDINFDVWCVIHATRISLIFLWDNEYTLICYRHSDTIFVLICLWEHICTFFRNTMHKLILQTILCVVLTGGGDRFRPPFLPYLNPHTRFVPKVSVLIFLCTKW
jgi:hypothetical protein